MTRVLWIISLAILAGIAPARAHTGYSVFYGNGIDNSPENAEFSRNLLEKQYASIAPDGKPITFLAAYASSLSATCDLYEVYLQSKEASDVLGEFAKVSVGLVGVISPKLALAVASAKAICLVYVKGNLTETGYTDTDLDQQIKDYKESIRDRDQRVLIVAHSQGNLYANRAFTAVKADSTFVGPNNIAMISVASPADEVADRRADDIWETGTFDLVISSLRLISHSTLPPTFGFPDQPQNLPALLGFNKGLTGDWLGHNFVRVYANASLDSWGLVKDQIDRGIAFLSVTSIPSTAVLIDTTTPGRYNDGIGMALNTNGSHDPFPCNKVACGDSSERFPTEPNLDAAASVLGNWLTSPASPGGAWSEAQTISTTWAENTETAIIYSFDAKTGIHNATLQLGVDNGVFVWLDGEYKFGARDGGEAALGEYSIELGDIGPGTHYLQVLREDHGAPTGYAIRLSGTFQTN